MVKRVGHMGALCPTTAILTEEHPMCPSCPFFYLSELVPG